MKRVLSLRTSGHRAGPGLVRLVARTALGARPGPEEQLRRRGRTLQASRQSALRLRPIPDAAQADLDGLRALIAAIQAQQAVAVMPAASASALEAYAGAALASQLGELDELRAIGVLSDDGFTAARATVLQKLAMGPQSRRRPHTALPSPPSPG